MQNKMKKPAVLCPELCAGVADLARVASAVYGNGMQIQYAVPNDGYASASSFAQLLKDASFGSANIARAVAVLRGAEVPAQGVKTAVILLDALLSRGTEVGCSKEEWYQIPALLEYSMTILKRIAAENNGQVPGGGLTFLTLCRPLQKYGRENQSEQAAGVLIYAMEQPLLKLAEAAGLNGYEVFERVKALAPNQFFSLHQVGIEDSIPVNSHYTDYIRMGLDLTDGKIKDLCMARQMLEATEVENILNFVGRSLYTILDIAAAIS
jgi:hypothetical protein